MRYVALLRGINVGRAKRVAMADLRSVVKELGYTSVRTLLNSGNVVFDGEDGMGARAGVRIEEAVAHRLGVRAKVTVLTASEVDVVVARNPLSEVADDPSRLLVCVPSDPADVARLKRLAKQDWTPEAIAVGKRVAYLWCPDGILAGRLPEAVGKVLGDAVTSRNWATVLKLHSLAATGPAS